MAGQWGDTIAVVVVAFLPAFLPLAGMVRSALIGAGAPGAALIAGEITFTESALMGISFLSFHRDNSDRFFSDTRSIDVLMPFTMVDDSFSVPVPQMSAIDLFRA